MRFVYKFFKHTTIPPWKYYHCVSEQVFLVTATRILSLNMLQHPEYFINVRDTACLHVAALLDPSVKGERMHIRLCKRVQLDRRAYHLAQTAPRSGVRQ